MPANLENSAVATGLEKVSFILIPKKGNAKKCLDYHTVALISPASKVMLKILQARLQKYVNHELPYVQARFQKGSGTRDQIANICWIIKKAQEFQKNIYFFYIDCAKIMASCPTASWQIDGETMETVTDFIFWGSRITVDGDCSHEIKRCLLLGRKVMTNLDSIFKSGDITLPTKVRLVKAVFCW